MTLLAEAMIPTKDRIPVSDLGRVPGALVTVSTDPPPSASTASAPPSSIVAPEPKPAAGWRAGAKRLIDIVGAAAGLALLVPLTLALAVLVMLDSPGPALFVQERIGKDGRTFRMFKFRTMVRDAPQMLSELRTSNEADGPLFKIARDPRITRVGRVLRRASLDELPQLWNVLRGDMSLVGPRPALPGEAAGWTPELYQRLRVKPGLTGMWQVNGRSSVSFDEYVRLDLYYVNNWSIATDLAILAKTLPAVLSGRGAS
ncbi:MAG TPA: sugar transferase [Acidimicrobiales bacterium]|nr:sugar transferase [Acidimicrobiales bacterium]